MLEAASPRNCDRLTAFRVRPPEPVLTPLEVAIVTGWYGGSSLTEIGAGAGISRQRVAQLIRRMRQRGIALTERPDAWSQRTPKARNVGGAAHG